MKQVDRAIVSQELETCPFCGGTPTLDDCRTIWAVRCSCGACMLGERAPEPDGSESDAYWDRIRQTAIDAWNRRDRTAVEAAILKEREARWLPIETAPKDGTDILVMYMHIETQVVHNAFFNADDPNDEPAWWSYDKSEASRARLDGFMTPTHWMPLPSAPAPHRRKE